MLNSRKKQRPVESAILSWLDSEIKRIAKTQSDAGAQARALLRLRSVGAPNDEISVVARPFTNACTRIVSSGKLEAPIEIAKPLWRK